MTGAGVALDAASRGLSVVAVDAHDLAFGTSRWSSKLVHGGLRYLAHGQVGVAHESAVERGVLMTRTAPHLTRALPMLIPLLPRRLAGRGAARPGPGCAAGDLLRRRRPHPARRAAPAAPALAAPRRSRLAPALRADGLRGGLLSWDGQLEDDARLVVGIARTAAAYGARILTRTRVTELTGDGATVRDELTGDHGDDPGPGGRQRRRRLGRRARARRPAAPLARHPPGAARGDAARADHRGDGAGAGSSATGSCSRCRSPTAGCTSGSPTSRVDGDVPDVPVPTDAEIDFLLDVIGRAFERPVTRADVVGAYAGLRPLLDTGAAGATADLSRRHAVLTSRRRRRDRRRRQADDVPPDGRGRRRRASLARTRLPAGPCRTRDLPLVGAAPREDAGPGRGAGPAGPQVRHRGARPARARPRAGAATTRPARPGRRGLATTTAELLWGVAHEGALDVDDLLDRRTRIGLVPADRLLAEAPRRGRSTSCARPGSASPLRPGSAA